MRVSDTSLAERADRLNRRRARMLPVLALFLLIQQSAFFGAGDGMRSVDMVRNGAWVVLTGVILAALLTGGFWFHSRDVRRLMEDDVTQANRASALALGFGLAMATAIALFALEAFAPGSASAREVIHIVVSVGLVAALLRFALLERRALA